MDAICKFDQLRIKTDTELVQLITHEVDLGLRAAALDSYARAARAYFEAARLMRISEISQKDRPVLESRLEGLAEALEMLTDPDRRLELAGCLVG
jgi:hypothetical protein